MPDKSDHSEPGMEPDILRHTTPPRLKFYGVVALCVAGGDRGGGAGPALLFQRARPRNGPRIRPCPACRPSRLKGTKAGGALDLPGDVEPFTNAPIYAQISGTVQKWYVDIGAHGEGRAICWPRSIRAPIRRRWTRRKAQLARDSATLANAKVDLTRYQALAAQNAISNQAARHPAGHRRCRCRPGRVRQGASADRPINLGYTSIVAPFGGIVTSRAVDVGKLVTVGTSARHAAFHRHRPDQAAHLCAHAADLSVGRSSPGMTAEFHGAGISRPQLHRQVDGQSAGAVASPAAAPSCCSSRSTTRTARSSRATMPRCISNSPPRSGAVRVPATALMFRDEGMVVATVDASNHVMLKPINIRTDLGDAVEATGLAADDRVIDNPPDSLRAGDLVKPSPEPETGRRQGL